VAAFCFACKRSPLFEIAGVLVRLDHVVRFVVNANHSAMCAVVLGKRGVNCSSRLADWLHRLG